jgi:hypothetical protein
MEDDRIIRIARALCRSARIDPDSILIGDELGEASGKAAAGPASAEPAMPAWTMFRGAALTFVHSHDDRVVSPL